MRIVVCAGFPEFNFDVKICRSSTDSVHLFHTHIGGMDAFAGALIIADNIVQKSDYKNICSAGCALAIYASTLKFFVA